MLSTHLGNLHQGISLHFMDILTHPPMGMGILRPPSTPLDLDTCTATLPMLFHLQTSLQPPQHTMVLFMYSLVNIALHRLQSLDTLISCPLTCLQEGQLHIMAILLALVIKELLQIDGPHQVPIQRAPRSLLHTLLHFSSLHL